MQLFEVPSTHIDMAWSDGACALEKACERADGEVTASQLKLMLSRGELKLLTDECKQAWVAVRFDQLPNLRVLFVYSIYAPGMTFPAAFEQLKAYARDNGASRIRGACQESVARLWTRKFGFREAYRIMEIDT
jgi:hypothetical protein